MLARFALLLSLVACFAARAAAQGIVRDDFEGPEPILRSAGGDIRPAIDLHDRVRQGVHAGRWCEHLRLNAANGTAVYFSYPVQPARVISEWKASVWLRSDRPGLQVMARVVLPRSKHPRTGEPLTTLIRGSDYRQVGAWQSLVIEGLPRALELQVRVLRSQFGPQVDAKEAYVDMLLLNVYGGPGVTNAWIDDLEIVGVVTAGASTEEVAGRGDPGGSRLASATSLPSVAAARAPNVELKSRLLVDDKPFFPRVIEFRGEPLSRLQALGFNCVSVPQVPSPDMLAEASHLELWLIAPPPPAAQLEGAGAKIGPEFDRVLAWNMGSGLSSRELPAVEHWAELVQAADDRQRPMVCSAESELESYTRPPFKVLLARRETLGSSLELHQFSAWLTERAQMARAGAPLWVSIPTDASPALMDQLRLFGGQAAPAPNWHEPQIRQLVHAALAARARGIVFSSHSRLDAEDSATRMRAAMLELVNLELELIERWPAAGNFSGNETTSDPQTMATVFETSMSRLVLPIYAPPGGQFVLGMQPASNLSLKIVGIPEGDKGYELSLTALRPLRATRITRGTHVVLEELARDSLVVFTPDPSVVSMLKKGIAKNQRRAAQLMREVAAMELAEIDATDQRLTQVGRAIPAVMELRGKAEAELRQSETLVATDAMRAYYQARHAQQFLRTMRRVHWEQATTTGVTALIDPFTVAFNTLPEHYRIAQELTSAARGANRLQEGGCEDLAAMLRAGWKHFLHKQTTVITSVDLSPTAAHSGRTGLLLRAGAADPKLQPAGVETPPVWVTTAPVAVEAGDWVQIQAWVRIDQPLTLSVDGLLIMDTLAGQSLATRLTKTEGWRQVTMFRAAPRSGPMAVTFALAGLGEAAIDDVTIQILQRGASAPQAQRIPTLPAPPAR